MHCAGMLPCLDLLTRSFECQECKTGTLTCQGEEIKTNWCRNGIAEDTIIHPLVLRKQYLKLSL